MDEMVGITRAGARRAARTLARYRWQVSGEVSLPPEHQPTEIGSLFGSIVRSFSHIWKHVASVAAEAIGPMFGLPPGVVFALTELLMHSHAGNPKARARVEQIAARDPKMKAAMTRLAIHLREHPHFAHFQAHAVAEQQKAAVRGYAGPAFGPSSISGTI